MSNPDRPYRSPYGDRPRFAPPDRPMENRPIRRDFPIMRSQSATIDRYPPRDQGYQPRRNSVVPPMSKYALHEKETEIYLSSLPIFNESDDPLADITNKHKQISEKFLSAIQNTCQATIKGMDMARECPYLSSSYFKTEKYKTHIEAYDKFLQSLEDGSSTSLSEFSFL